MRRAGALVLAAATLLPAVPARAAQVVEYLTIEANEAGASGGHAALRVGARVFHFEAADGRLRLAREPWPEFRFRYRVVENRTLHAQRIDADAEAAAALARHFDRRLWSEVLERERVAALEREVRVIEALEAAARGEPARIRVPGAGFFEAPSAAGAPEGSAGAEAIRALGRTIAREHGPGFVARRLAESRAALLALRTGRVDAAPAAPGFAQRYVEQLAAVRALEVLRDAPRLRRSALAVLPDGIATLSAAERRGLRARRDALRARLVRLVASQRPDWGAAFALGMARLAALSESLASGRLVVLDALPPEARRIGPASLRRADAPLRAHLARSRRLLASARGRLLAESFDERDHARLEAAASRTAELARALSSAGAGGLRVASGPIAPRGVAGVAVADTRADVAGPALAAALGAARARLRAAHAALDARHGYDLVANNCVTAIFREVEAAAAASPEALAALRRSAAASDPVGPALRALRFVPFVSAHAVARGWPVVEVRTLPSYRSERIAALRAREPAWRVALRESNTVTSTVYAGSPDDSVFLFFTDDRAWSRPLLGAANLAAGVAWGTAGLLRLPWDGGRQLLRGVRGVAASLPELVFVNVRKGSFPFALPPDAAGLRLEAPPSR